MANFWVIWGGHLGSESNLNLHSLRIDLQIISNLTPTPEIDSDPFPPALTRPLLLKLSNKNLLQIF